MKDKKNVHVLLLVFITVSAVFGHCLQLKVLEETITRSAREKKDSSIGKETFFPWKYSFELNLAVHFP